MKRGAVTHTVITTPPPFPFMVVLDGFFRAGSCSPQFVLPLEVHIARGGPRVCYSFPPQWLGQDLSLLTSPLPDHSHGGAHPIDSLKPLRIASFILVGLLSFSRSISRFPFAILFPTLHFFRSRRRHGVLMRPDSAFSFLSLSPFLTAPQTPVLPPPPCALSKFMSVRASASASAFFSTKPACV